jgi:hypothetical protein
VTGENCKAGSKEEEAGKKKSHACYLLPYISIFELPDNRQYLVIQGVFTIGTIVAFGAYLNQLYGPLSAMSNAHIELATSMVSW